jgi:hypothetical protein
VHHNSSRYQVAYGHVRASCCLQDIQWYVTDLLSRTRTDSQGNPDEQLHAMLNGVLDIPLAQTLPTPNARKTYALTISFLCDLTLPSEVLGSAADRIGSAIQRGVEGELGKEGKRGSIADGLRVSFW